MTFLASHHHGRGDTGERLGGEWQSEVASEITIQVLPTPGRDLDRDGAGGCGRARLHPASSSQAYTKEESAKLLEPWLGSGLSLDELPVPRLIVARLHPAPRSIFRLARPLEARCPAPASTITVPGSSACVR